MNIGKLCTRGVWLSGEVDRTHSISATREALEVQVDRKLRGAAAGPGERPDDDEGGQ